MVKWAQVPRMDPWPARAQLMLTQRLMQQQLPFEPDQAHRSKQSGSLGATQQRVHSAEQNSVLNWKPSAKEPVRLSL